jgi:MFS transporter, PPP family, 3-phenylpropionic acid transporter
MPRPEAGAAGRAACIRACRPSTCCYFGAIGVFVPYLLLLPAARGIQRRGDRPADGDSHGHARARAGPVGLGADRSGRRDLAIRVGALLAAGGAALLRARPVPGGRARPGGLRVAVERPAAAVRGHDPRAPRRPSAALRPGQAVGLDRLHPGGDRWRLRFPASARGGAAGPGRCWCWARPSPCGGCRRCRPRRPSSPNAAWPGAAAPRVLALLLVCVLQQAAFGPYYVFFTIYLDRLGYGTGMAGLLWAWGVAAEVAMFLYTPRLIERFGSRALAGLRPRRVGRPLAADRLGRRELLPLLLFAQTCTWRPSACFMPSPCCWCIVPSAAGCRAGGQALYSALGFGVGGALGSLAAATRGTPWARPRPGRARRWWPPSRRWRWPGGAWGAIAHRSTGRARLNRAGAWHGTMRT